MIDKSDWDNERHDQRYEAYFGTKEEWIKAKLSNGADNIREKDLKDFLSYIEDLEGYLKHRTQMFRLLDKGGKLMITEYGKSIVQISGGDNSGSGYSDDNMDFIYVNENWTGAKLVKVT